MVDAVRDLTGSSMRLIRSEERLVDRLVFKVNTRPSLLSLTVRLLPELWHEFPPHYCPGAHGETRERLKTALGQDAKWIGEIEPQ